MEKKQWGVQICQPTPTKALCFLQPPCPWAPEKADPYRGQLILLWNYWVLTSPGLDFTPSHNDGCDSLVAKETVQKSPKLSSTPKCEPSKHLPPEHPWGEWVNE